MSHADLRDLDTPALPARSRGSGTRIATTVQNAAGVEAPVVYHVAHLPCDVNQDGFVNITDASAWGAEWGGARRPELIDTNRDGTVNISDSTAWGQLYSGSGSFIMWNGKSLPSQP